MGFYLLVFCAVVSCFSLLSCFAHPTGLTVEKVLVIVINSMVDRRRGFCIMACRRREDVKGDVRVYRF